MNLIEQWQEQLGESIAEFAGIAVEIDGIDFMYGILATAVLWPVRQRLQTFDGQVIAALREITGGAAKHLIYAVKDWDDDRLTCARSLAAQARSNPQLKPELTALINYFDAAQIFSSHLAQAVARSQGGGDIVNIAGQIKAAVVNIGGITNIDSLIVTLNTNLPEPLPPQPGSLWTRIALGVIVAVLISVAGWYIYNHYFLPMKAGFNIAVARLTVLDRTIPSSVGSELSDWLFEAIKQETEQLPAVIGIHIMGPDRIGNIKGDDRETRAKRAAEIARRYRATILIYGVIVKDANGPQVQLEFYVSSEGFNFGSEIVGPDRLGQPVVFDPTLDPSERFKINTRLNARARALQYLVTGLAYFYIGRYEAAEREFVEASGVEDWQSNEGQEVVYLLIGAARLRLYDPLTHSEQLALAGQSFEQAHRLNNNYGRSYLGLGAVAFEQATQVNSEAGGVVDVDELKLLEAEKWYLASLNTVDQPVSAYIPLKAAYGLGQVHLLGFEQSVQGFSGSQAWDFFNQVAAAYEAEPAPDLAWFAAHAHANMGRLAGDNRQWQLMSSESHKAIDIFDQLPGTRPRNWIARFWAQVGFAEAQRDQPALARAAYQKAIEIGDGFVGPKELQIWRDGLNAVETGAGPDGP